MSFYNPNIIKKKLNNLYFCIFKIIFLWLWGLKPKKLCQTNKIVINYFYKTYIH